MTRQRRGCDSALHGAASLTTRKKPVPSGAERCVGREAFSSPVTGAVGTEIKSCPPHPGDSASGGEHSAESPQTRGPALPERDSPQRSLGRVGAETGHGGNGGQVGRGDPGAGGSLASTGGEPGPTRCPRQTRSPRAARRRARGLGSPWHPACGILDTCLYRAGLCRSAAYFP